MVLIVLGSIFRLRLGLLRLSTSYSRLVYGVSTCRSRKNFPLDSSYRDTDGVKGYMFAHGLTSSYSTLCL